MKGTLGLFASANETPFPLVQVNSQEPLANIVDITDNVLFANAKYFVSVSKTTDYGYTYELIFCNCKCSQNIIIDKYS